MFARYLIAFACVIGLCNRAIGDEQDNAQQRRRIKILVEMLASKNPSPTEKGREHFERLPKTYDKNAQAVVFLAIRGLLQEGAPAIDELLNHLEDHRYSYSYESPVGNYNHSVGSVCYRIINRLVHCYEDQGKLRWMTQDQVDVSAPGFQVSKKWWEKHRSTPLWKLQIAAIDAQIDFMTNVDREKASPPHRHLERLSTEEFEECREHNLKVLRNMKVAITALEEPHRPLGIQERFGHVFGLPWPTPTFGGLR